MGSIKANSYEEFISDSSNCLELKTECENLIFTSCYDDESKYSLEQQIQFYSEEELYNLKINLLMNQRDNIDCGFNYTQTDIKNKLK